MSEDIGVLVVDDEPGLSELIGTHLERLDEEFVIVAETDPRDALAFLEGATDFVDCLVADYAMSPIDGLELLDAARECRPDLPFILFTGVERDGLVEEAVEAGVTDVLSKGRTDQHHLLANRIRFAVERHRAQRRARRAGSELESAYERTSDGVVKLDDDWRCVYVNDAAGELLDREPSSLVQTRLWASVPSLSETTFERNLRLVGDDGTSVAFESYVPGLETSFHVHAYPSQRGMTVLFRTADRTARPTRRR
jgi:CheY-like chemotaxis protein